MDVWFAHDVIREPQKKLISVIDSCVKAKQSAILHAPTGLGKTAAALAPTVKWAYENKGTVLFLTSRHTQHNIVIETAEKIKKKFKIPLVVSSIIGKKHMCAHDVEEIYSSDFAQWCKSLRNSDACSFYSMSKSSNPKRLILLEQLKINSPQDVSVVKDESKASGLCPYETALQLCQDAHIIVADYNYFFNDSIRHNFFKKIDKTLDKCIVVIDEAHNVPERLREMFSRHLSLRMLRNGLQECKKHNLEEAHKIILELQGILEQCERDDRDEYIIDANLINNALKSLGDDSTLTQTLKDGAEVVMETEKKSSLNQIAHFLELWNESHADYLRVVKKDKYGTAIHQRCLDPSENISSLWKDVHCSILMSGTLSPTSMFRDILGMDAATAEFPSPFQKEKRLTMVVPSITTKFTARNEKLYDDMGRICAEIANTVQGCNAVFFPSYNIRNEAAKRFEKDYRGRIFYETPNTTKDEKNKLLNEFRKSILTGGVLLAVSTGSFGEGIDLPGVLSSVIVAGLPLERPDLETDARIKHFEAKFNKLLGRTYAYTLPALSKCFQNVGRCIRREQDKGALIFLEERFAWPMYKQFFPSDWDIKVTKDYVPELRNFFK